MLGIHDKAVYGRKKVYSQVFSDAAIRGYEGKVRETIEEFCGKMLEGQDENGWSEAKDMSPWCEFFPAYPEYL